MKKLILLVATSLSISAYATEDYVDCLPKETDKECVQRVVKASQVMTQNFYTGVPAERPMIFNAIYSNTPVMTLLESNGEGGDVFEDYLLVYPVEGTEYSGLKAATFMATLEKSFEDETPSPKVIGRAVNVLSIQILTGATEEVEP